MLCSLCCLPHPGAASLCRRDRGNHRQSRVQSQSLALPLPGLHGGFSQASENSAASSTWGHRSAYSQNRRRQMPYLEKHKWQERILFASPASLVSKACCFSCRNSKVCPLAMWWCRVVGAEGSSGPSDQGWGSQTRQAGRMVLAKGFLCQTTVYLNHWFYYGGLERHSCPLRRCIVKRLQFWE